MRFVIFSHAHPRFSKGGGEAAAYYQYQGLVAAGHEAWFIARAPREDVVAHLDLNALGNNEYLLASNTDFFLGTSLTLSGTSTLAQLLQGIQPDVVHFHHYLHLGVELIRFVAQFSPQARILLTLHEFIAICANNGQMVKTNHSLCYHASPRDCIKCFPEQTLESFFLREHYIKSFFHLVELYISPSKFLRERYLAWGLPPEKTHLIEYGLPVAARLPPRAISTGKSRCRFAYFGQITPFKGVDLILDAFSLLPRRLRSLVHLDIYGANLEIWPKKFQSRVKQLLTKNQDFIRYHGSYEQHEMADLLKNTDWVVMGSIWWENSPLVIQEAYTYGRPVIAPDIGGMAEKIQDGVTGRLFRARDPVSLANIIEELVELPDDTYTAMCENLPVPWGIDAMTEEYLRLLKNHG